jgi:aminoglycoside phosphotransferase (APT) family kinase protein
MVRGIDAAPVGAWLERNIATARPPFQFELIAAGGSNLTYRVTDADGHVWALRRPPVSARLPTAHDMSREWRILSALDPTPVPVPEPIAFCADASVNGAPFYVMGFADGKILRKVHSCEGMSRADCDAATDSLLEVQIGFHTLDVDAIGLGDLGRRENYVERQLHRWRTQYERTNARQLPLLEELHDRLSKAVPRESAPPGIAHGDYRFDNTVLGPDHRIIAVLDWELCTLGSPIADFAWSLLYWGDPGDRMYFIPDVPTLYPEFVRRAEFAQMYADRTGYDLSQLDYFISFGWWKMACICEGAYGRHLAGAGGGMESGSLEDLAQRVEDLLEMSADAARGVI